MKNNKLILGIIAALSVALIAILIAFIVQSTKQSKQIEQLEVEKERMELEHEYADLAEQYALYEGQKMVLKNDSLIERLEAEQIKVQRLYEELKSEKATSAKRIAELRKELETLRGIMRVYVAQIDSLNQENKNLRAENRKVRKKYEDISARAEELLNERDSLTAKVTIASKLDAVNIQVTPLRSNGKVAKSIKQIDKLEITFSIAKNVTATTGEKMIYARLRKPDGDIMIKNDNNLFPFEGSEIPYSCAKMIEYAGDEISEVAIYWDVDEYLYPGDYEVEIFADNYVIGRGSFSLKK
jgi:predicted  nucleic acid-binding Zn-ribbon protein